MNKPMTGRQHPFEWKSDAIFHLQAVLYKSHIKQCYTIKKSSEMRETGYGIQDLEMRSYSERVADRTAIAGFGESRKRLPSLLRAAIAIAFSLLQLRIANSQQRKVSNPRFQIIQEALFSRPICSREVRGAKWEKLNLI